MLGEDAINILFAHAMLGCDTTYRVFRVGKEVSLRLVRESDSFGVQESIFQKPSATKDEIAAVGERTMTLIYKG